MPGLDLKSDGMMCSFSELGQIVDQTVSGEEHKILILDRFGDLLRHMIMDIQ